MPLFQAVYHPFAKSAPLVLRVCLFDVVIAALLIACKDFIDVHGLFAGCVRDLCLSLNLGHGCKLWQSVAHLRFRRLHPTLPLSGRQEAIAFEAELPAACPLQGLVGLSRCAADSKQA